MRKIFLLFFSLFLILSCDSDDNDDNSIGYDINCVVKIHKDDFSVSREGRNCTVTGNILKAMVPPENRGLELDSANHTYTTITASSRERQLGTVGVSGKKWEYVYSGWLQVEVILK